MAQHLKVAPTKSALLGLRRQIKFLQEGHDLLERKRELLTRLVYEQLTIYRRIRSEVRAALTDAYESLAVTHMRMGVRMLRQTGLGLGPAVSVRILPRSNLGVEYPAVSIEHLPLEPLSLLWTDASFDNTRRKLADLAGMLAQLGQAETTLRRMLAEQRKTQKRVNALKYNIIPRYRETIRYIQSALEEEERNTLFQIKLLRKEQGD
jgi:V/A-type H+-transporting ATPase subunit D